jgi:hypothetical protein
VPEIDWSTVTTAAATALVVTSVVTVSVEYLAKPRLEARKERILDQLRARRALIALIVDLTFSADAVAVDVPKDADAAARERILAERRRHYVRMGELTLELSDHVGKYAGCLPLAGARGRDGVRDVRSRCGDLASPTAPPGPNHRRLGLQMAMVIDDPLRRGIRRMRALHGLPVRSGHRIHIEAVQATAPGGVGGVRVWAGVDTPHVSRRWTMSSACRV